MHAKTGNQIDWQAEYRNLKQYHLQLNLRKKRSTPPDAHPDELQLDCRLLYLRSSLLVLFFFHFLRPLSMFLIRFFGSPCKKKKKCLDHFCVFICMRVVVPSSCWNRQENAKERETRQKDYPPLAVSHNRSWRKSLPVRRKNRRTFFFLFQ